jgi:hypothetical protein
MKMAVFRVVAPCGLVEVNRRFRGCFTIRASAQLIEAASISETSVKFYQATRRNNPEGGQLHTCKLLELVSLKHL